MSRLDTMLAEIGAAARLPGPERPREVAAAIAAHVADPALLCDRPCAPAADRYTRHLLAEDPDAGYAVAALVWSPGQMSRVHSHLTWCALGVHAGVLTETLYDLPHQADAATVEARACLLRRPGDISHCAADPSAVHRVANLGTAVAVSIHVYGAVFADFTTAVNRILAA
jgi:predicted metal-dependent enzyme (double-stranded beta helix superfamily)